MIMVEGLRLHGGIIGDYDENHYMVTLLPDWVPYLKEYGITEFEHRDNRGRQIIDEKNKKVYLNGKSKRKVVLKKSSEYNTRNKLNNLKGNEWLYFTKTVLQTSYPHSYGHDLRRKHGGCKPPQLMQHIIEYFTKKSMTVLDPFAGVGGTMIGSSIAERKCIGIELNKQWIDIYKEVCKRENITIQEVIEGDCLDVLDIFNDEKRIFDFVVTDPPYSIALDKTMCDDIYDIQHRKTDFYGFSKDERDFRNLKTFEDFYDKMKIVGDKLKKILKPNGYFVIIIRDSYQDSRYIPVTYEISKRMEEVGFTLKGIKIWYSTGSRIRPYGYPYVYVPNIVHQNLIILRNE